MKNLHLKVIPWLLRFCVILQLQFAYSQNIKKAEYFFDNEPGIGMATPIAGFIADSTAGYTFTANIGNLTPGGYHYIYVRVMDSLGNWSVVSSQYFLVNPLGATPVITNVTFRLAQAEYFIDADPGTGHGIPMFIFAGDSINQAYTVNIASLSAGNHIIGFRVKDVGQNWSVVGTKSFLIKTTACSPPNALFSSDIVNAGSVTHLTNLSTNTNVGTTYLWKISKPPDSVMATTLNMSYTFASPGYYDVSLKAYNTDTCTSFWKQKVLVGPVLSKAITITGNTVFCDGDSVLLLAPNGSNFQWSTGATTQQITVKTSGNFQVTYIDLNGNGAVSNIVSVLVNPVLSLTVTVSPANNGLSNGSALATVSGGSGYIYTYNWSTTQTTPVVTGLAAGTYSVIVSDGICPVMKNYTIPGITSAPHGIIRAEYYIDDVLQPAQALTISFGDSINSFCNVPLTGVAYGYHFLYVRVMDTTGLWSSTAGVMFKVDTTVTTAVDNGYHLTRAEYFIDDVDPGVGFGTPLAITANTADSTSQTFSIPLSSSLPQGFHNIAVRAFDSRTGWGIITRNPFYIQPATDLFPPQTSINYKLVTAEYYYDSDPGIGNGTPLYISPTDLIDQPYTTSISGLAAGTHQLFLRVKDLIGKWSVVNFVNFTVVAPNACTTPIVDFSVSPSPASVGQVVNFINTSSQLNGGTTYAWDINNDNVADFTTGNGVYTWAQAGIYPVKLTVNNGGNCISSVIHYVTVGTILPNLISTSGPTEFCQGGSVTLTAPAGSNYQWTTGETTSSIVASITGNYQVIYTDLNGILSVSNIVPVTVDPQMTISVNVSSASNGLANGSASAIVSGGSSGAYQYLYSTGETLSTALNLASGGYSVWISDGKCPVTTPFTVPNITVTSGLVYGEYYIDETPDVGTPHPFVFAEGDTVNTFVHVSTTGLGYGNHYFNARFKETTGLWTIPYQTSFFVSQPIVVSIDTTTPLITAIEYYFDDNDPGPGNGYHISVTTPTNSLDQTFNAPAVGLSGGMHNISVRVRDDKQNWSTILDHMIYVIPATANTIIDTIQTPIVLAEYFVDTDPGPGNGTHIPVTAGYTIDKNFTVNLTGLSIGDHYVLIRVKDMRNNWGIIGSQIVHIVPPNGCVTPIADFSIPTVNAGQVANFTNLSGNTNIYTQYSWYFTNGLNPDALTLNGSHTYASPGTYDVKLTVSNGSNCQATIIKQINIGPILSNTISASGNLVFCSGDSVILTAPSGTNYFWSDGETSQSITVKTTGIYQVVYTDTYGNVRTSNTVDVIVNPSLNIITSVSNTNDGLSNGSASVSVSGGSSSVYSYLWITGATVPIISGIPAGAYTVHISDGVCPADRTLNVPNVIGDNGGIVAAEYFFDSDPGAGLATSVPVSMGDSINSFINASTTGLSQGFHNFLIRVKLASGLWGIVQTSQFFISPAIVIPPADTLPYIIAAEYFYNTDPGIGHGTPIPIPTPASSIDLNTNLSISGVNFGSNILAIRVKDNQNKWSVINAQPFMYCNPSASPVAANDTTVCQGSSLTLHASTVTGATYSWSGPNGFASTQQNPVITVDTTKRGFYKVYTVNNGNCYSHPDSLYLAVNILPPKPGYITGHATTCLVDTVIFFVPPIAGATGYDWNIPVPYTVLSGLNTNTIAVKFNTVQTGAVPVKVRGISNCGNGPYSDVFNFTVNALYTFNEYYSTCYGTPYHWHNNNYSTAGTYHISYTTINGCDSSYYLHLTVNPVYSYDEYATICSNNPYSWRGQSLSATGTYYDHHLTVNGCDSAYILHLTVNPNFVPTFTQLGPYCVGSTPGVLPTTSNNGIVGTWNHTIRTDSAGTYTYTFTPGTGQCQTPGSMTINVTAPVLPTFTTLGPYCQGSTPGVLPTTSLNGITGTWNGPISTSVAGAFTFTFIPSAGMCAIVAKMTVVINVSTIPTFAQLGPYCRGATPDVLPLVSTNGIYGTWNGPISTVNSGSYYYTFTPTPITGVCSTTATMHIVVNAPDVPTFTQLGPYCPGETHGILPTTSNNGITGVWNTGISTASPGTTVYTFTPSSAYCATTATMSVLVKTNSIAPAVINGTQSQWIGINTTLTVGGGSLGTGATWAWYANSVGGTPIGTGTTLSVNPSTPTTYYVRAEGPCDTTAPASRLIYPPLHHLPTLTYTNNTGFVNQICNPTNGKPSDDYRFEVRYTNSDGFFPAQTYPRLQLDFEGNGVFTNTNDRLIYMQEVDPADQDVTDGKDYYCIVSNLPESSNWQSTISVLSDPNNTGVIVPPLLRTPVVIIDPSGIVKWGPFPVPLVLNATDITIFANDITFSDYHPNPGDFITVNATIHNYTGSPADNFVVHLVNQFDPSVVFPNITVTHLGAYSSTTVNWTIQTPANPAWCPMQVFIDWTNVLAEPNELDNQAIRPFTNGNYTLPGKIMITANPTPTVAPQNSTIGICGHAWYVGTAVLLLDPSCAGATVTWTVVETGTTGSTYTNSLGNYCFNVWAPFPPGIYHVNVHITDYTLNGDTTCQFEITAPLITLCADLSCSISVGPQTINPSGCYWNGCVNILQGQSLSGTVTVTNSGNFACGATVLHIDSPDGVPNPTGNFSIPPLAPGASYVVSIPSMVFNNLGGTYISATADYTGLVSECYEYNNGSNVCIMVHPAMPDIAVYGNLYSEYYECQFNSISYRLDNAGGVATGPFNNSVDIFEEGVYLTTLFKSVSNLPPLSCTTITFDWLSPHTPGNYIFIFNADIGHTVAELDETNNSLTEHTKLDTCKADLTVYNCYNLTVDPTDPTFPGTITIHATIANLGLIAVSNFDMNFDVAGVNHLINHPGILNSGQTEVISLTVPTPAFGNNLLTVTMDPADAIDESNEHNNVATGTLCWDFYLSDFCSGGAFWDYTQNKGQPVTLNVGVNNSGMYRASNLKIKFEVRGPGLIGWVNLGDATTFCGSTACQCPFGVNLPGPFAFPQVGTYQVRMTADPYNAYIECDETNNVLIVDVHVTDKPDYRELSQYIAPNKLNPELNEPITIDVTYENIGTSSTDTLTLFTKVDNTYLNEITVPGLMGGTFSTVHLPVTWSSSVRGIHIIRTSIDYHHSITEVQELNNEATRAIIVGKAPNLIFTGFNVGNPFPSLGSVDAIDATIKNVGYDSCNAMYSLYYLDNSNHEILIGQQPISLDTGEVVHINVPWTVLDSKTTLIGRISNGIPVEYDLTDNEASVDIGGVMALDFVTRPASCYSLPDGFAKVLIDGGEAPYSIAWNNGQNIDSIYGPAGNYFVNVTDANGITVSGNVSITQPAAVIVGVSISPSVNPVCQNSYVNFTATVSNGGLSPSYQWRVNGHNVGYNSAIFVYIPNDGDSVTCMVYSSLTYCVIGNPATSNLVVMSVKTPLGDLGPIIGLDTVCQGQYGVTYHLLNSSTSTVYHWILPPGAAGFSTISSIFVTYSSLAVSGNIKVYATNVCGTSDTSTLYVHVNALPAKPPIIYGTPSICIGQTGVQYHINVIPGATSYIWTLPGGATGGSVTNSIMVNYPGGATSGIITVRGVNNCGQGTADSLAITVHPLPIAIITPHGPTTFCANNSVDLWAGNGATYLWSTGATTQSITANLAGNYFVTVSNAFGCSAVSAPIAITTLPVPYDIHTILFDNEYAPSVVLLASSQCTGLSAEVRIIHPQEGVSYQLINQGVPSGSAQSCTCDTLDLHSAVLTTNAHFQIAATNLSNGCQIMLDTSLDVIVYPPAIDVQLKLYLEGLYLGNGLMHEAKSTGFAAKWGTGIADVITVELHDVANYHNIIYSNDQVYLSTAGNAEISLPCGFSESCYLTIKHRNSIETVSANPIALTGQSVYYDFTTASYRAYGSNEKFMGSVFVIYGGDENQDGIIDGSDMGAIDNASTVILNGYYPEDINGDGLVDASDMAIIDNNSTAVVHKITP